MPHVLVSTQTRLETGPCTVGDEQSDPETMRFLEAKLIQQLGNNFKEYRTELCPRMVLDKLETLGYNLVAVTGVGQTCIFSLNKPADKQEKNGGQ